MFSPIDSDLKCSVPRCRTRPKQCLRFYPFPIFDLEICSIWQKRIGATSSIEIDPLKAQVCELHFDYRCKTGKDCALEQDSLPSLNLPGSSDLSTDITHIHSSADNVVEPDFEISADVLSQHCRLCFGKGLLYEIEASTYGNKSFLELINVLSDTKHGSSPSNACLSCLKSVMTSTWLIRAAKHSNTVLELLQHPEHGKLMINRYDNYFDIKSELASCSLILSDTRSTRSNVETKSFGDTKQECEDNCNDNKEVINNSATLLNRNPLKVEETPEVDGESVSNVAVEEAEPLIITDSSENSGINVEEVDNDSQNLTSNRNNTSRRFHCNECNIEFALRSYFVKHNSRVHFICSICNQPNASAEELTSHNDAVHTKRLQCDVCCKMYNKSQYRSHMKLAHRKVAKLCKLCGKIAKGRHNCSDSTKAIVTDEYLSTQSSFTGSPVLIKSEPLEQIDEPSYEEVANSSPTLLDHNEFKVELSEFDVESGSCAKLEETDYNDPLTPLNSNVSDEDVEDEIQNSASSKGSQHFHCTECKVDFSKQGYLMRHNHRVHLTCSICDQRKASTKELTAHYAEHTQFRCKICFKVLNRSWYRGHMLGHRRLPKLCNLCGKTVKGEHKCPASITERYDCTHCSFTTKYKICLQNHLATHIPKGKRFVCAHCGKGFYQKNSLYFHNKQQHVVLENPIQCGFCPNQSKTKYDYQQHKISHWFQPKAVANQTDKNVHWNADEGVYMCSECDWKNPSYEAFSAHKENHVERSTIESEGKKSTQTMPIRNADGKLQCNECPRAFRVMSILMRHKKTHSDEIPYKCEFCSKSYRSPSNMKKHMLSVHSEGQLFPCKLCDRSFKTPDYLKAHLKRHDKPRKCQLCDKTFAQLKRHMRTVHNICSSN